MEPLTLALLLVACALILGGEFVNGWTDAPNALAPLIATRVTNVWVAIVLGVYTFAFLVFIILPMRVMPTLLISWSMNVAETTFH